MSNLSFIIKFWVLRWHISSTGGFYDIAGAGYWEDKVNFYDETKFTGG